MTAGDKIKLRAELAGKAMQGFFLGHWRLIFHTSVKEKIMQQ